MSIRKKKLLWPIALLVIAATALTFISVRAKTTDTVRAKAIIPPPPASSAPQSEGKSGTDFKARLARQPYALRLAMQVGKRFRNSKRAQSVFVGTLRLNNDEQRVRILRRQTDDGERVEIALGSGPTALTWSPQEGVKSSGAAPSNTERLLIERLVLDTPDAFILAQLRGASYQVISHNVRPAEAGGRDDYQGPVWDIIRVGEPAKADSTGLLSRWRLYRINVSNGLIDSIVSYEDGIEIVASLFWTGQGEEKVPSRIIWTRQGQPQMQLDFTGFNYSTEQS